MPNRYVILHHVLRDGEHWDLMLEEGRVLLTWQLLKEPLGAKSLPIPARRIGDHRKAYLEYEGPVSGDRGHVTRVDRGSLTFVHRSPEYYVMELSGGRFEGRFKLSLPLSPGGMGVSSIAATVEGWVFDLADAG